MPDALRADDDVGHAAPSGVVTLADATDAAAAGRFAPWEVDPQLTHIRRDPIVERYVIVAPRRALRPNEFSAAKDQATLPVVANVTPAHCPFCEGHEHLATHETMALRAAGTAVDSPGWRVRSIANKFPAAAPHEVIVESPRHLASITQLTAEQLTEVLSVYRHRMSALAAMPGVRYVHLFKNVGADAGASLEHLHSQIVGLPLVPPNVQAELDAARRFAATHNACIFCDLIARELACGQRVIAQTTHFVALAAFAGRFPLETWIMPRQHAQQFTQSPSNHDGELAQLLRSCIEKIEQSGHNLSYNYLVHTAPFDTADITHYHWHIEILPRTTTTAGFEWGTGMFINPVLPEQAAKLLRND